MNTFNNPMILGAIFLPLGGAALSLLLVHNRTYQHIIGLVSVVGAWLCTLGVMYYNLTEGPQVYRLGGWPTPYGIVLAPDMLGALFGVMTSTVVMGGVIYTLGCNDKCVTYPIFMPLFLCMAGGLHGAMYTGDIFTLFVFIELMVMSSVILVAISDNRLGVEAAIKYLLISAPVGQP